jgi:hypothetical protein
MGTRGSFPGDKAVGREADYSSPSRAEVKNAWSFTSIPNTPSWRGVQLKAQGQLYLLPLPYKYK